MKRYNSLRTSCKHSKDHKCCQFSAKGNLVISELLSMDTGVEFQKITGGKLLLLFDRYILSQQNNTQIFKSCF